MTGKTLLLFVTLYSHSLSIDGTELITLYSAEDSVIELTDANITSNIYDPSKFWVVEFYANWCGYCQRFSPTWKSVAADFDVSPWNGVVHIGAINCAQQNCDSFAIQGTPTIRIFYGGSASGRGKDIPVVRDDKATRANILQHVEKAQIMGYLPGPSLPKLELLTRLDVDLSQTGKSWVAFIVEDSPEGTLGRNVIFKAAGTLPNIVVRRMGWLLAVNLEQQYHSMLYPSAVIAVPVENGRLNWNSLVIRQSNANVPTIDAYTTDMLQFLRSLGTASDQKPVYTLTTMKPFISSTTVAFTTTPSSLIQVGGKTDQVHMGDLERAIQYIVDIEILAHEFLDQQKMSTIYQLFEIILKNLPLKEHTRNFLLALRDWPILMGLQTTSGFNYKEKVEELIKVYKPFRGTPDSWKGCSGSKPFLRGYPCSLWQLFHTLLVNSNEHSDASIAGGGPNSVAKAMVNYIYYFFSCRDCANNFAVKVHSLGYLPVSTRDGKLWLWQIHNMANVKLKGDITEDPHHPKVIWPTKSNCPRCRSTRRDLIGIDLHTALVQGQLWNITEVASYLDSVYLADNLVPTPTVQPSSPENKRDALKRLLADVIDSREETNETLPLDTLTHTTNGTFPTDLTEKLVDEYCTKFVSTTSD